MGRFYSQQYPPQPNKGKIMAKSLQEKVDSHVKYLPKVNEEVEATAKALGFSIERTIGLLTLSAVNGNGYKLYSMQRELCNGDSGYQASGGAQGQSAFTSDDIPF